MIDTARAAVPGSGGPGIGQAVATKNIALHPHVCWLGQGGLSGLSIFIS
jgi:hypothetical protein